MIPARWVPRVQFDHEQSSEFLRVARVGLGAYLLVHFLQLLPWGVELFSRSGMLPASAASPLAHAFPNLLTWLDLPVVAVGMVALGGLGSIALLVGWRDRVAALVVWYVWACLFGRNPLIANPSIPFIGWILLYWAALPRGAVGRIHVPRAYFGAAWLVSGLAYTYGGLTKLSSLSWRDGTALAEVFNSPLGRDNVVVDALLSAPTPLLTGLTWGALAVEVLAAPLTLSSRARPWLWGALTTLHLGILATVDFADLTVGMLAVHLFLFDPKWLTGGRRRGAISAEISRHPST